jgi:hypothetical protein
MQGASGGVATALVQQHLHAGRLSSVTRARPLIEPGVTLLLAAPHARHVRGQSRSMIRAGDTPRSP